MYWIIGIVAVVALAVNSWWRRSIARNYKELIAEIVEKRSGAVKDVYVAARKRKKYANTRDRDSDVNVLWSTDEGFPMDFQYTRKREKAENIKFTLKSVVQDASGNVYLEGQERDSKEERSIDITTLASHLKLPMYKIMPLDELMETVCGLRLHFNK
ncbi:hypothetical protein [Halodesulfovibrio marinisediminis]|uniref:Uncharacterized protein n=1 Tax=Halodesulfovibrio marinisediminis DSM 17456 TaxID=1121457 RepID=A0A1N6I252_9BACT|nr:hypothetical protein [Halodesulfovibrio marinisediminis]SIO26120.1 hypothetical protein SAMN02745161_2356 [Halodesulfovibrio marinisediminis DSM 17456]